MREINVGGNGGIGGFGGNGGVGGVGGFGNSRKQYAQPKLITHGSVEKLTQSITIPGGDHGSSLPIDWHHGD